MRKLFILCSLSMMLVAADAYAAGNPGNALCNRAFPGSLKVCHPMGTSPAGVLDLGGGWQLALLAPFSGWRNVQSTTSPTIATFHNGKLVSLDRHIPYFENMQSVLVAASPTGGHVVTIHAYKGGNAQDRTFTMTVHVTPNGQIIAP